MNIEKQAISNLFLLKMRFPAKSFIYLNKIKS